MKVVEIAVSELRPYENNPRVNDLAVPQVAESIKQFGWQQPIVIDKNNVIIAGHTRYKAALRLGLETVPCKYADELTPEQVEAYRLADNKTAELATWDDEKLAEELAKCAEFDMSAFGFIDGTSWFDNHETAEATEDDTDEYKAFTQKFEQKHTTDDCYTPEPVYEAVADYVVEKYHVKRDDFVRPFYPGGDYQHEEYRRECVVVDNPPFSIFREIVTFYIQNGIKFFLFCPCLAALNYADECTSINIQAAVTYENGANVPTSFCTNLEDEEIVAESDPELYKKIKKAVEEYRSSITKELPRYKYPNEVLTAAMLGYLSHYGEKLVVRRQDCVHIRVLDAQKEQGKAIYGGGLLLSEKAAAEKAAAEKAAAIEWPLSEREKRIVNELD